MQIDIDGRLLSLRYPMDVNLKGDAQQTLAALVPLLQPQERPRLAGAGRRGGAAVVEGRRGPGHAGRQQRPAQPGTGLLGTQPQAARSLHSLGRQRHQRQLVRAGPEDPPRHAAPAAAATWPRWGRPCPTPWRAKFCFPDRVCIAVTGDGAMQMNGLNACITVAKYWTEWSDPRWITLVLNNRDLNQVTWEQRIMMGDIRFVASQDVPDFPYANFRRIDRHAGHPRGTSRGPRRRLGPGAGRDRPVILEAITDPDTPTLPPHITWQMAKNFTETLLRVDPEERGIVKQAIKGMVEA